MKSTVVQLLIVFFSYSSISSAVRHYDPFEDFLRRETLRQNERRQQQKEERLRQEEQQNHHGSLLQDAMYSGSGQEPTGVPEGVSLFVSITQDVTRTPAYEVTTDTPRRQETQNTCCVLGTRAGRSGFLCNPENYRQQVLLRDDLNRPGNNFKIARVDRQRYVEVRQYSKCISGAVPRLSEEFQRCCKQGYLETLDEDVIGADEGSEMPIMLELPLQFDIISKQRKVPHTRHKTHVKV